jgi:hypothetical protein
VSRPAIVQRVERNALTGSLVHADFYQVSLRERMKGVPVVLIGTSDAVATYNGASRSDRYRPDRGSVDIPTTSRSRLGSDRPRFLIHVGSS